MVTYTLFVRKEDGNCLLFTKLSYLRAYCLCIDYIGVFNHKIVLWHLRDYIVLPVKFLFFFFVFFVFPSNWKLFNYSFNEIGALLSITEVSVERSFQEKTSEFQQ